MREFRERNNWKRVVYSRWVLLAVIVIALFMMNAVWHSYVRARASATDQAQMEQKARLVEQRAAVLTAQIKSLETDEGLDRAIRQKFNVVKPGENVVMIIGGDTGDAPVASSTEEKSWWRDLMDSIF